MESSSACRIPRSETLIPEQTTLEFKQIEPIGYLLSKRVVDIVISVILLSVFLPIFMAVALAIYIEDGGPILYFQLRTGHHGRAFRFYKFRTMYTNADEIKAKLSGHNEANGPIFKIKNDPRVTRIGRFLRRFSIDEAPQLINVLQGNMSLIGPRPLPVSEAQGCTESQWRRHSIKPGLLCYREVSGRSALSFEKWMETDLAYVERHSMSIDVSILLRAIPAVLRGDGAY